MTKTKMPQLKRQTKQRQDETRVPIPDNGTESLLAVTNDMNDLSDNETKKVNDVTYD